jgi:hypothetical protein
MTGKEER